MLIVTSALCKVTLQVIVCRLQFFKENTVYDVTDSKSKARAFWDIGTKDHDEELYDTTDYSTPTVVTESAKFSEPLPFSPAWTMPQPVCFWGNPSQFFGGPSSSGSTPNAGPFSPSQSNGVPSQQENPQPINVQVKANTVQIMERTREQSVDRTKAAVPNAPIFPWNQQSESQHPAMTAQSIPSTVFQQPIAGMPYFCAYMTIPSVGFPPESSQFDRASADKVKNLSEQSLFGKDRKSIFSTTWKEYPGNVICCFPFFLQLSSEA